MASNYGPNPYSPDTAEWLEHEQLNRNYKEQRLRALGLDPVTETEPLDVAGVLIDGLIFTAQATILVAGFIVVAGAVASIFYTAVIVVGVIVA